MRLKGKTALITGGGSGIGAAIAERFVAEGAKVCISGRRRERLEKLADRYPGSMVTCPGDVAYVDDVKRMVETTLGLHGTMDILVNNAAFDVLGPITELELHEWERVLAVNLTGPFLLMREAIPPMVRGGGGSIINIASIGGIRCMPASPAYGSSKAALIHLTKAVALDYGPVGIRCNAVCPGATRTEMFEATLAEQAAAQGNDPQTVLERFARPAPLRRIASPEEMAGVCAFLASDDSSFMTGAVLVVDGGVNAVDAAAVALF